MSGTRGGGSSLSPPLDGSAWSAKTRVGFERKALAFLNIHLIFVTLETFQKRLADENAELRRQLAASTKGGDA